MELILVALFAAVAPTLAAVATVISARATARQAEAAALSAKKAATESQATNVTLQGNGHGTVPAMLEHLVKWTETHDDRHVQLDALNRFLIEGTPTLASGARPARRNTPARPPGHELY